MPLFALDQPKVLSFGVEVVFVLCKGNIFHLFALDELDECCFRRYICFMQRKYLKQLLLSFHQATHQGIFPEEEKRNLYMHEYLQEF